MKNCWLVQEIWRNSKARKSAIAKSIVYRTQGKSPHIAPCSQCSYFLFSWVTNTAIEGRHRNRDGKAQSSSGAQGGRHDCKHRVLPPQVILCWGHLIPNWSFKPPVSYKTGVLQDSPFTRHPTQLQVARGTGDAVMDRSFMEKTEVSGLMLLSCHPYTSLWATQTEGDDRHMNSRVEYLLQASWRSPLFPFQVTKNERQVMKPLYDRYRLVKQILSRANTIPIIVSRVLFCGVFLWKQEAGITTLPLTTQSLRLSPSLPYHSKIKQMSESMTRFILKLGKAGQGTLVPTCEPRGTSHLVLFLLFPLGCCCYFIHPVWYSLTSFSIPTHAEL